MILVLLKPFLFKGFESQSNMKIGYCFCDGLLNIVNTLAKDKQNTTAAPLCVFTLKSFVELINLSVDFLS